MAVAERDKFIFIKKKGVNYENVASRIYKQFKYSGFCHNATLYLYLRAWCREYILVFICYLRAFIWKHLRFKFMHPNYLSLL